MNDEKSTKQLIHEYVSKKTGYLLQEKENSGGKATLARLRRGIGKTPGEIPELWGIFLNELPARLTSNNGIPTSAEWAVYISMTLFAMHQQGSSDSVHAEGISFGKAVAGLMDENTDEERGRIMRRFAPIITAKDMPEFSHHMRCMIQLFKANEKIHLDYVKLAEDIYDFQYEESRKKVQLRWGQDFYYTEKEKGE